MKSIKVIVLTAVLTIFAVGCSTGGPKQTGGTIVGGAAGGLLGSQFGKGSGRLVAVGVGTLAGALIGGSIGKSMDEQDRHLASKTMHNALEHQPDNRASSWHNPNNSHRGNVVVTNTYEQPNKVCRDFVHTVDIDGQQEQVHGRACRDVRDNRAAWIVQK